jgi:hypothetical protein
MLIDGDIDKQRVLRQAFLLRHEPNLQDGKRSGGSWR